MGEGIPKTREFLGGYAAGIDDTKGMSATDIVRVAKGDMRMARMVHYYRHRERGVSGEYLEGWSRAIGDAHKTMEAVRCRA